MPTSPHPNRTPAPRSAPQGQTEPLPGGSPPFLFVPPCLYVQLGNTKNTITVDKPWDSPRPNKTSQYVLSHNVQEVKPMGNTMGIKDMEDYEKEALKMDKKWGRLDLDNLNKNYKYIDKSKI